MTNRDIIALVIKDIEDKKVFDAHYDAVCSECRSPILEGDQFIFMGNKQKVCLERCQPEILEHLGSL